MKTDQIDNKKNNMTLDQWEKAYTQAPPVMRPDSHSYNDDQLKNYPKAGDWGLKIPAGLEKKAATDEDPTVNEAIRQKQAQWMTDMNQRHAEMRQALPSQPALDQVRMNLTIATEKSAYEKWTNPDRSNIDGKQAYDSYIKNFSSLIKHDKEQGHPVATHENRDFEQEPVTPREQYEWLKRDGRETTAQERSYIQSTDLWGASAPQMAERTNPKPVVQKDFDEEVFGQEPAKIETPKVEPAKAQQEAIAKVQPRQDQGDQRPSLDVGGFKDRLNSRRIPSEEEFRAEMRRDFGHIQFQNKGLSPEERVEKFSDVSKQATDVRQGRSIQPPRQGQDQKPGMDEMQKVRM